MKTIIRAAGDEDMVRVQEIYAHYVLHGTASFEEVPPDADEMRHRRDAVAIANCLRSSATVVMARQSVCIARWASGKPAH